MKFLEKDLEAILMESDIKEINARGLYMPRIRRNQVKVGNYGVIDVAAITRGTIRFTDGKVGHVDPSVLIYELKKDEITDSSIKQVIRYMWGVKRYLNSRGKYDYVIHGIVVGSSINLSSELLYLCDMIDGMFNLSFYTYNYSIDGISFSIQYGYSLSDEGFLNDKNNGDE